MPEASLIYVKNEDDWISLYNNQVMEYELVNESALNFYLEEGEEALKLLRD